MALTPSGMFYLGKEDLASERELLGKGVRGLFGLQNEEEAVANIIKNTDMTSAESRADALEKIRRVSPEQYKYWRKENEDYERTLTQSRIASLKEQQAKMDLKTAEDKKLAMKNRPILRAKFLQTGTPGKLRRKYLLETYGDITLQDKGVDINTVDNDTQFRIALRKLGLNPTDVTNASKDVDNLISEKESFYISENQLRTDLEATPTEFKKSAIFKSSASELAPLDTLSDTRKYIAPKEALPVEIPIDDRLAP